MVQPPIYARIIKERPTGRVRYARNMFGLVSPRFEVVRTVERIQYGQVFDTFDRVVWVRAGTNLVFQLAEEFERVNRGDKA